MGSLHKLYIRQCKCHLELGRIPAAQAAFDRAIDAIDKCGLAKDLRKGLATELQDAFISLAAHSGEISHEEEDAHALPAWTEIEERHAKYPAASSAISIEYDDAFGRHVVAARDIEVGEVVFNEAPIVSILDQEEDATTEACVNCMAYIKDSVPVPCPTCYAAVFCSLACRREAFSTYHKYECRLAPAFRDLGLDKLPLIMMVLRAVTQKPVAFFREMAASEAFAEHDVRNGVTEAQSEVFLSSDYRNLFHLVTHEAERDALDVATKTVFAAFVVQCLRTVNYFGSEADEEDEVLVGRLVLHFLQCFQFNTHMVESVYENRVISPQDAETRIWKDADRLVQI